MIHKIQSDILIPSQPVFALFLLNAECLAEKQQIPIE
jgi:hypothetical protein